MKKVFSLFFIVMFSVFSFFSNVSADTGDFYEKHEERFDDANFSDTYMDTVKAFDSETNDFDCGITEVTCSINAFTMKPVLGLINIIASGTKLLVLEPSMITKDAKFVELKKAFSKLSYTMLSIFLAWQIMASLVQRYMSTEELPDEYNQHLIKTVMCGILLGVYTYLFDFILNIQKLAMSGLLDVSFKRDDLLVMFFFNTPAYSILYGVVVGLVNLVFLLALTYRYVLFGFLYVVGPLAIPTGVNQEYNYFSVWLRLIINNVVTLISQTIMFMLAMSALTGSLGFISSISSPYLAGTLGFLLSIVMLFVALVIPSMLGNLGSSTGTGRSLGRVARFAVTRR